MNAAALLSAVGLYASWMLSNSRIPFALAEDGYLPASIAKLHPKYGSPWISILVCSIICSAFILGPFQGLVAIDVTVYAFALALEFASLSALRRSHPDLERPFKVPGGWIGVFLATLFPMLVTVAAIWFLAQLRSAPPGTRRGEALPARVELVIGAAIAAGMAFSYFVMS